MCAGARPTVPWHVQLKLESGHASGGVATLGRAVCARLLSLCSGEASVLERSAAFLEAAGDRHRALQILEASCAALWRSARAPPQRCSQVNLQVRERLAAADGVVAALDVASACTLLGQAKGALGERAAQMELLWRAHSLCCGAAGADSKAALSALHNLALAYHAAGDHAKEAQVCTSPQA